MNGKPTRAYVDTGCGAILIKEEAAQVLGLKYFPSSMVISLYGGSSVPAIGEVEIELALDCARANVKALVTPNYVQDVPIMVGQPFLNLPEVVVLIIGEVVRIVTPDTDLNDVLKLEARKIPLWPKDNVMIPPKTSVLVAVTWRIGFDGEVYVPGGLRPIPGQEHYLGECITLGENGFVSITNVSYQNLEEK